MTCRPFARGIAVLIAAAIMGALVPVLFGAPRPRVFVTWRDVGNSERVQLERRFALSEATPLGEGAWGYVPLDTSPETLRALVRLESVATTDGIDRSSFRISSRSPLTPRRGGLIPDAPRAARALKGTAYSLALIGVVLLVRVGLTTSGVTVGAFASWLARGIPVISPRSLAAFRIVFGVLVTGYLLYEPVYHALLDPYEVSAARGLYGAIVRTLAERPRLIEALPFAVLGSGAAFVAGLRPRISFAVLTACVLVWACVLTLRTTSHMVSALVLTMVSLLPARWGDAFSLDAVLRRRRVGREVVSGFPVWVPLFTLGVTFAAAAWAKLQNGLGWILNGTVKYHFVTDMDHAWVDWGVRLTESHAVAVALSAGAVIVEVLIVTAAFSRSGWYRMAIGIATVALLAGFALFQGVVWLAWWILLIAFLPWGRFVPLHAAAAAMPVRLRPAELLVIVFVIVQQLYVSMRHVEARPLFTAYDMYSTTYSSPEAYEAASNLEYRVVEVDEHRAADLPGCVVDEAGARAVAAAADGDVSARARVRGLLGPCLADRRGVSMVRLEGDRQVYDWQQRRFDWRRRVEVIGPVRVDWIYE